MPVCLSVFPVALLENRTAELCRIPNFRVCCLWPWLGPLLTALRYVDTLQFFGCRHVFIPWNQWARIKHDIMFRRVRRVVVRYQLDVRHCVQRHCVRQNLAPGAPGAKSAICDCFVWFDSLQGTVSVPWLSIAKSVPVYALMAAHFTNNFGYYTLLTCLPQYFKHILHFDIKSVSLSIVNIVLSFVDCLLVF